MKPPRATHLTSDSLGIIPREAHAKTILKWRSEYTTRKIVLIHSRDCEELVSSKLPGFDLYLRLDDLLCEGQKEAV